MVKQGDIIKLDFTPTKGHEQSGYRPAIVVSNDRFHSISNLAIVCPITNTKRNFPLHIPLDNTTITTGFIMCEQVKSLDLTTRNFKFIEKAPANILKKVTHLVNLQF